MLSVDYGIIGTFKEVVVVASVTLARAGGACPCESGDVFVHFSQYGRERADARGQRKVQGQNCGMGQLMPGTDTRQIDAFALGVPPADPLHSGGVSGGTPFIHSYPFFISLAALWIPRHLRFSAAAAPMSCLMAR